MTDALRGVREVSRLLDQMDRACTKDRQKHLVAALRVAVVPQAKALARRSPGKAGPLLAKYTTARNGRRGAVLLGPKTGQRGAWFRAFFIAGSKRHAIGGGADGGGAGTRGGWLGRRSAPSGRRFLGNPTTGMRAWGPVQHPGLAGNAFVTEAMGDGQERFITEVRERLLVGVWRSGGKGRL